jgi:hypothetical protein
MPDTQTDPDVTCQPEFQSQLAIELNIMSQVFTGTLMILTGRQTWG